LLTLILAFLSKKTGTSFTIMESSSRYANYPSLRDKNVVVSGGATGIGASFVEEFALQGAQVIFLDIQNIAASSLIERLASRGVSHIPIFIECDVTDIDGSVRTAAASIRSQFNHIHALINNAANDVRQSTLDITLDQWDQGIAVNLRHVFFLTQALMPALIASGSGSVINMGSISWAIPGTGIAPYIASKAAIVGLTKTLAHEFGNQGVRVNSIMPGAIATDRQKRDILTPEYVKQVLDRQALKRILQPDEVARLALWLVADDSAGVTNQSIVIDGGCI
jgi:NAD(P)-dependent dehydrogenase (short-subunit alcohol dehydrogenase family)